MWREMNPQIICNNQRMSRTLLADRNVDFVIDDEHEKLRMNKTTNELANLVSSLNLRSGVTLIVQLAIVTRGNC